MNPASDISQVAIAKKSTVSTLFTFCEPGPDLESYASLDSPKDKALFFCLTALAKEFFDNRYARDFVNAAEGFEENCFDRCIEIIKEAELKAELEAAD